MGAVRKYNGRRQWTKEEEQYITKMSEKYSDSWMAKKLNRTVNSVKCKRVMMGICSYTDQTDKLTGSEIGRLVGVDKSSIYTTWVRNGFVLQTLGRNKVASEEEVVKFMKQHPELWKASKCDYYFFMRYKWFTDRLQRERGGIEKYVSYRNYRRWTPNEVSRVKMLMRRGLTHKEIAEQIGRSKQSVSRLSMKLKREKA